MNDRNERPSKAMQFFEEKGFYIVLALCAVAIGTAGYVLFMAPDSTDPNTVLYDPSATTTPVVMTTGAQDAPVSGEEDPSAPVAALDVSGRTTTAATTKATTAATTASTTTASPKPATTKAIKKTTTKAAATTTAKPTADFFVSPVSGEVYQTYSGEELVYDRTNGDWRTHNGVDFLCSDGEKVMAIADGEVADIYTDDYYGTSVLIDHGNGLNSVYLGLVTEATVFVGQKVRAGDVVGAVDADALFEASLPVHFHLEVLQDGKRIDPMTLIG